VFVFGFAKSVRANLTAEELKTYRKAAKIALELDGTKIDAEIAAGRLMEVKHDEDL
jgi:hypothetical protein